jgi:hypothetical protein
MDDEERQNYRTLPQSDLDLQLRLTDSVWGQMDVPPELRDRLMRLTTSYDVDGTPVVNKESLWGLLGMYTRDIRLGNLSSWDNEMFVCRYYLDLSADLLNAGQLNSFIVALSRAATIIETSQSKGGFLRRLINTFRREEVHQQLEPPKKGFFGGKKEM